LKSGNIGYHSMQNILSFGLLPKIYVLKHTELSFCLLMCMGVKLGPSH